MKSSLGLLATAVAVYVSFPIEAQAAILNSGFENGLESWEAIGDYRLETADFGTAPVKGTSQLFLSTASDLDFPAGNAVIVPFISNFPNLEEFLEVSTFFGDNFLSSITTNEPIEGSAIRQTFQARKGQKLSFRWNFLTDEATGENADFNYNDLAFATLKFNQENFIFKLADTTSTFLSQDSQTAFFYETGYHTFSYIIPESGEYTLGVGVVDVGEASVISGLLVDEAKIVPEASSVLSLFAVSTLGMGILKRRRNKLF